MAKLICLKACQNGSNRFRKDALYDSTDAAFNNATSDWINQNFDFAPPQQEPQVETKPVDTVEDRTPGELDRGRHYRVTRSRIIGNPSRGKRGRAGLQSKGRKYN